MQTRRLGRNGPEMSVIGFGAWEAGKGAEWGAAPPDEQILAAIRSVFETDITWIDTAEVYGRGTSEEFVGRAIAGRRDDVFIATKVGADPPGTGYRPKQVAEACRGSLRRLGVDHVDLYQVHWPDESVPLEDTWGAMAELVDDGLVRFIGLSNFRREDIDLCMAIRHVDSLQQEFSMLVLEDRELIRWCGEQGVGVLAYGPLGYGLLTGAITVDTQFAKADHRVSGGAGSSIFAPGNRERSLAVADALRPIAGRVGCTMAQLALAWTFHQPGVTGAIAGSRDSKHVRDNAAAGAIELDEPTLAELESVLELGPSSEG